MTDNDGAPYTLKDVMTKLDDLTEIVWEIRMLHVEMKTTQIQHTDKIKANTEDVGSLKKFMWKINGATIVLAVFANSLWERLIKGE